MGSTTLIEYKKIGRPDQDMYIVLIDGSEIGQPCTKMVAEAVVAWMMSAIGDLRAKL